MIAACAGAAVPCAARQPAAAPPEAAPGPADGADPYEGRLVREVRLVTPGEGGALEPLGEGLAQLARNQIRTVVGRPYRQSTVISDIGRLNRLGRFERAESFVQLLEDGTVAVIYSLIEQAVIEDVQVVGNRRIGDQQIAEVVDVLAGTPVDRLQIDRAARRIEDLYRRRGYYLAQVTIDEEALRESGILLFRIREGERVKVTAIRFEGNDTFTPAELRSAVRTKTAWLLEKGPLDDDVLEDDVASLVEFYRNRGYLDVRAGYQVRPSPNGKEAIVIFHVDEGPLYTLRSVDVQFMGRGEERVAEGRFTAEQLAGLMLVKPGDVYAVNALERSIRSIEGAYGKLGYADVRVARREVRDLQSPQVDLILFIDEGQPYRVGEVIVIGNDITKHDVIMRRVEVRPERPLDPEALEETRRRLAATRLFAVDFQTGQSSVRVVPQPEDPATPGYRDVLVEVEETNTGQISFGVAYGSDAGAYGRFVIEQRNFDIADLPDSPGELFSGRAFRGAGQTLTIRAEPGTEFQEYSISLKEPSLLETDYSGGISVFYRDRRFREYDEQRYGTRLNAGRRFGTLWEGGIFTRIESIALSDLDEDAPVDIFEVEDRNLLTSVGLTLSRNTTDDPYRPSRGTRLDLTVEQVGLFGGDFDFTRLTAEHTIFLTLNESFLGYRTVLSLNTRVGYIPQDEDEVPVYERFYLGGRSLRGFAFRTVAPKGIRNDTGERGNDPVGGTWQLAFTPELIVPVWKDSLAVALFTDIGTVTNDPGLEDIRVGLGAGIRLHIPQLSPLPLAFDFAVPLLKEDGDRERLFTFSVDLPF